MKYLIIDDNPDIRKMIVRKVCLENDDFVECSDGEDAVSSYAKFLPDYVLMDIQMPKIDGLIATQIIIEKFPNARVIIITDYDTTPFRLAAKRVGASAFVSKENLSEVKEFISNGVMNW